MLKRGGHAPLLQRTKKSNLGGIYGGKGFLLQASFQNAIIRMRLLFDSQTLPEEIFGTAMYGVSQAASRSFSNIVSEIFPSEGKAVRTHRGNPS